jgi:hypothetical protein
VCVCNAGYFGKACDLTQTTYLGLVTFRELLCAKVYQSMALEDVTLESVKSRLQLVGSILTQREQISDAALRNCTAALVETVEESPTLACQSGALSLAVSALSSVLEKGAGSLDASLVTVISDAAAALSLGCHSISAIGEPPTVAENDNLRLLSAVVRPSDSRLLEVPQTELEIFNNAPVSSVLIDQDSASLTDARGVSLILYKNNPRGLNSSAGQLGVQLAAQSSLSAGSRTSSSSRQDASSGFSVVLQNSEPIYYINVPPSNVILRCDRPFQHDAYVVNGTCPSGAALSVPCPSMSKRTYNVTCPSAAARPQCSSFDGAQYVVNPACTVVAFTATNTTCHCVEVASDLAARRLAGSEGELIELSTLSAVTTVDAAETFTSVPPVTEVSLDMVVLSTLYSLAGIFLAGSVGFMMWDGADTWAKVKPREADKVRGRIRTVNFFFDSLFPDELRAGAWRVRLGSRLLLEHPWLRLGAPHSAKEVPRVESWLVAAGSLLVLLFVNTVVALVTYADDGYCEGIEDHDACTAATTAGGLFPACRWRADNASCQYEAPAMDFLTVVCVTLTVAVLAAPLDAAWALLVRNAAQWFRGWGATSAVTAETAEGAGLVGQDYDELQVAQSRRRGRVLRAARLHRAHQLMDYVPVEGEALGVLSQLASERELRKFKSVREVASAVLLSHTHYGAGLSSLEAVNRRLVQARVDASQLRQALAEMESSPQRQEELLIKHFVAHTLTGCTQAVVPKHLLGRQRPVSGQYRHVASVVLLPGYAAAMVYVVWVFLESMGSRSTALWMLVYILAVAQSIFLVQPAKIAVTWMLLNRGPSEEARRVWEGLSRHAVLLLRRSFGLLRDCDAMVQHFNPACRVARLYPALPVSRLLMSVNDADLQRFGVPRNSRLDLPGSWLLREPALVQVVLEVGASAAIDLGLVLLYMAGRFSVGLLVAVLVLGTAAVLHFAFNAFSPLTTYWRRNRSKVYAQREDFFCEDEDGNLPLSSTVQPSKTAAALAALKETPAANFNDRLTSSVGRRMFTARPQAVTLRDGKRVLVPGRVAPFKPLGDIARMNRAFCVEAPADLDLMKAMLVRAALTRLPEETKHEGGCSRLSSQASDSLEGKLQSSSLLPIKSIHVGSGVEAQCSGSLLEKLSTLSGPNRTATDLRDSRNRISARSPSSTRGRQSPVKLQGLRPRYAKDASLEEPSLLSLGTAVHDPWKFDAGGLDAMSLGAFAVDDESLQRLGRSSHSRQQRAPYLPCGDSSVDGAASLLSQQFSPNQETTGRNRPLAFMQEICSEQQQHDEDLMSVRSYVSSAVPIGAPTRVRQVGGSPYRPAVTAEPPPGERSSPSPAATISMGGRKRAVPRRPQPIPDRLLRCGVGTAGPGEDSAQHLTETLVDQLTVATANPVALNALTRPSVGRSSRMRQRGARLAQLQERGKRAPASVLWEEPRGEDTFAPGYFGPLLSSADNGMT